MSVSLRARPWHRYSAALFGALTAFALGAIGQPPAEEEDPKGGVKKKVVVEDDPPVVVKPPTPNPVPGNGTSPDVRLDELFRAFEEARNPGLKTLFYANAFPYDRLTGTKNVVVRVKPIPLSRAETFPNPFGVIERSTDGQFGQEHAIGRAEVKKIEYFEELALADANKLLNMKPLGSAAGPEGLTVADQLAAAELVMSAALRFHDYARERNIRVKKGWDEIRKPLADRLREVRLLELKDAVAASDWARVNATGTRLMVNYPRDTDVAKAVAAARVQEAKLLLASEKHFDHRRAKELLDEFEARFPGEGGEAVRAIRSEITTRAQNLFQRAKEKKAVNDLTTARDALAQAAALDPTIPGLREMQRELGAGYQTLYVGVRQYPVNMSPATARTDSEKQVVELLFESLLAEVPDDGGGVRYRPGAAVAMPAVVPNGREFVLRTQERRPSGPSGFESHDVVATLKLMQSRPHTWGGYVLPWFDNELPTPKDINTVRVGFGKGHPDPRALLTFKLLPGQWMLANGKAIDDAGFAEKPTGTGPYKLHANPKAEGNVPREMVFVDNPFYGRWKDRMNQPFIKEIRLVEVAKVHNLVESFQQGSLHVLTDVPTADIDKFLGANLRDRVQVYTATNNRRIHMLAINHARPYLQSKTFRQGLSMAIDREAILADVFRAGKPEFHSAMGGPFPPRCWATTKGPGGAPVPLVNRDLATAKLRDYASQNGSRELISLVYPEDDPQAAPACNKIKQQIEALFKDYSGKKLSIQLEPLSTRDLIKRVEEQHIYDLAYLPFEYPDDWYPYALGAMLDPNAADLGGRNWTGFLKTGNGEDASATLLGGLLQTDIFRYREFNQLASKTVEIHKLFNECVPFVPLWQLDRHTLIANAVKVYTEDSERPADPRVLNPTLLFQGVARWRLEGAK